MSLPRRRALAPALVAVLVVGAFVACGRKGPPVAPEHRAPQPVSDLRGVVREGAIELAWSVPDRRMDDTKLTNPGLARVFRTDDAGQGDPKSALLSNNRIAGYTEIGTIPLGDSSAPPRQEGMAFTDRNLAGGRRYTYVVVTVDAQGRTSPPSPRVMLTFLATPEPPADLKAEAGERQVRLSWRPPARLSDGSPVDAPLVYEILRSSSPDGPLAPVARTEPGAGAATDAGLENDRTYHYAVRAIRQEGASQAEGQATPRVAATPTNLTPPAPPSDLLAIPSPGTVRLSWTPSPDRGVARYVVHRADGAGPFERVGSVRAPGTTFTDADLRAGTYRYAVTAQDASVRANESARTNEVTVTVPQ